MTSLANSPDYQNGKVVINPPVRIGSGDTLNSKAVDFEVVFLTQAALTKILPGDKDRFGK